MANYGGVDPVLVRTGVAPEDLGFIADEGGGSGDSFSEFITSVLEEITDLMDRKMRKSYLEEVPIPSGLHAIANDIAADSLRTMVASRQTPVVRIDDFAVKIITARTFSPDILDRLKLYSAGSGVASYGLAQETLAPIDDGLAAEQIV